MKRAIAAWLRSPGYKEIRRQQVIALFNEPQRRRERRGRKKRAMPAVRFPLSISIKVSDRFFILRNRRTRLGTDS
ncbi:hypothetical protein [Nostoc edaphicum]|uniref:hypothetical protein n=1 Tax=Nostoc edaphicum TaxID=264686 RepID=UPI001D1413B3|nr:hypothetical protein [Nostoc edaphicum]